MESDPHENILPWQPHEVTDPVSDTDALAGSYCRGKIPILSGGRGECGNQINYHEDSGSQQTDYTLASYGNRGAQHTGQAVASQGGYICDQSHDLSGTSRSTNQVRYNDPTRPEYPTGTSRLWQPMPRIPITEPEGALIDSCWSATYGYERPESVPLSHKPFQEPPPSNQCHFNTREELRDESPQEYDVHSEDDLKALEFPDDFGIEAEKWFSPVQRRIQAFGATIEENEWMESQQQVIVSKYFRNIKDATFFKSVRDTRHWHSVKDDPAFAEISSHGAVIAFEELHQHRDDTAFSNNVPEAYRRRSNSSTAGDQYDYPIFSVQKAAAIGLSMEQEERLAALGVTGDPKPVQPRIPTKGEGRRRSRSPEPIGQRKNGQSYRQRRYAHGSQAVRSGDRREDQEPRDRSSDSLGASMGRESGRNVEIGLRRGQENQDRGKEQKIKGKKRQQQSQKPSGKSRRQDQQA
ncbi:uncharacterized protein PV07_00069 [Cladophialophora immunda]|uniref:Uncharacterized protein n=1 Tax=Cladophialophora immunda TaxID=569365 RepID=A0A0D2DBU9_9EURO|nr:uncharacterized protein PV07_00069 [Cladophialophora immunda]KIW33199.1 hypothetical protein PV07_00069 [Cladophialophora immunda]OQU99983.1 hypothetical protein CLAIMM_05548 [Cladophialophora immunda]